MDDGKVDNDGAGEQSMSQLGDYTYFRNYVQYTDTWLVCFQMR